MIEFLAKNECRHLFTLAENSLFSLAFIWTPFHTNIIHNNIDLAIVKMIKPDRKKKLIHDQVVSSQIWHINPNFSSFRAEKFFSGQFLLNN